MAKDKSVILCLFDYKSNTGFGTVSHNIIKELKKLYQNEIVLHICAVNYFGDTIEEDENTLVFSAIKSAPKKDDFGRFGFLKILKDSDEYDGIFIMQDLGVIVPIIEVLSYIKKEKTENKKPAFKSIFYFPVDCPLIEGLVRKLEFFDCLVTYTEYGRNEVLRLRPELKSKLKVIPHGINTKDFNPLPESEKKLLRTELFGKNADKFIILNLNRNQPRKDIPTTIFAFMEAKRIWDENLPKPFLYLHMNPKDPMGWDLRALFLQTDLVEGEDYQLIQRDIENHGAGVNKVNDIYNASDVYLTTTLGEGWGLGITEAMACKLPVIAPYNTSIIEIGGYQSERVLHLKTQIPYANTIDNVIRSQSDYAEIAETLLDLAKNTNSSAINEKVERAYTWVHKLRWDTLAKNWYNHFKTTFK